ncbi:MAG: hypothetical protein FJW30_01715 [Acidobacteria bacterium]|nr:hypothetical protein [Acidobacteriota bacterium]
MIDFLLSLYPARVRKEFGDEMRAVYRQRCQGRVSLREVHGLLCDAVRAWRDEPFSGLLAAAAGSVLAICLHLLAYRILVPVAFLAWPLLGQDAVATAAAIYGKQFEALRAAKNVEDLLKISNELDDAEWISVDRFGRTVFDRAGSQRQLTQMLDIPPERRTVRMDILWAGHDKDRLTVVAWMITGATETVVNAVLIRDVFTQTPAGWRRVRHDKLTPNQIVIEREGRRTVAATVR